MFIVFLILAVYIETGVSGNSPITVTVVTSGSGFARQWRIKVTQLSCDSTSKGWFLKTTILLAKLNGSLFIQLTTVVCSITPEFQGRFNPLITMESMGVSFPIRIIQFASGQNLDFVA